MRFHQKTVVAIIFALASLYAGFFIYDAVLRIIWFGGADIVNFEERLNKDLYDKVSNDFTEKSDRLQRKINKIYIDPFK